jgi:hypothetical protein
MHTQRAQYSNKETANIEVFATKLRESAASNGTFDSAGADDFISTVTSQSAEALGVHMPKSLGVLLEEMKAPEQNRVIRGLLDGIANYEAQHGETPTADKIEAALAQGFATSDFARRKFSLDSASSLQSDPLSLQPNRAVVAITAALAEAIPVANYLPVDIGSNQAKLVIVSHLAGNNYGLYSQNALMDGVYSGQPYVTSARVDTGVLQSEGANTGSYLSQLTQVQATTETCNYAATPVKLMPGRGIVYINGYPAAFEVPGQSGATTGQISGSITLGGTTYNLSGQVTYATGSFIVTPSAALPAGTVVLTESFINYEASPGTTPTIITNAQPFNLYASPWRVVTEQSIDTRTQFANELGLDPAAESMLAVRFQFANERHYDVLRKAYRIGQNRAYTFNMNWAAEGTYKTRAKIWQDFSAVIGAASQQMAQDTIDHGITHLYVSKNVMAQLIALPTDIFEPSGVTVRPGIYRIGRLFGQYEVYFSPYVAFDSTDGTTATIVGIGRSTQVARCPFVLGDAVPPTVNPIPMNVDQISGAAFYARNFTSVNPHQPSSMGACIFTITNMNLNS